MVHTVRPGRRQGERAPKPTGTQCSTDQPSLDALITGIRPCHRPRRSRPRTPTEIGAEKIVQLAHDHGVELFHTSDFDPYAIVPINGHRQVFAIWTSEDFKGLLYLWYYHAAREVPRMGMVAQARQRLAGIAMFEGPEYPPLPRQGRKVVGG